MTIQAIDYQQIRLDHDLYTVIEKYLGEPKGKKWLCPFHNEKTPSFSVVPGGVKYKCFGCGASGDVTDFVAYMDKITPKEAAQKLGGYLLDLGLSPVEIRQKQAEIRAEYERRQEERKAEEASKRQSAIERISQMTHTVECYHAQVDEAIPYWRSQGLSDYAIRRYKLGYCQRCPTYPKSASYTIPYFNYGELVSIRHRLANPNGDGKYRPEFAGLPNQLFNLDALESEPGLLGPGEVLLVEGEVKSLFLHVERKIPAVGVPGAEAWSDEWIPLFAGTQTVYVMFDPYAERQAQAVAQTLAGNGISARQVTISCKPDDFFVKYGGSLADFLRIIEQGRKVR